MFVRLFDIILNIIFSETPRTIHFYSLADNARKAELIWAMKNIFADFSFSLCDEIKEVYCSMFLTENAVPKDFSLSHTKMSYLITDAIGPYFKNEILNDIDSSYSLLYDKTTN